MIDTLLSIVAPHHCCGCGKSGSLLCPNCKYNITSETKNVCLACGRPSFRPGVCNTCKVPYSQAWFVGERKDVLQRLVGLYKFERAKSADKDLAGLLDDILPQLPENTMIVPIPTVPAHVRERGYDHTLLLAKRLGRIRRLPVAKILVRNTNTMQRHATAAARGLQAKIAFRVVGKVDENINYLIVDDVVTTGATVRYAAKVLKDAGATQVWVAVLARQTLD